MGAIRFRLRTIELEHSASGVCADAFFDHAAVEQRDGAVGELGVARIVRHHADGGAAAVQFAQQVHDGFAVGRIEVAGGLVGQQDRGIAARARATATRCCWPPESCEG